MSDLGPISRAALAAGQRLAADTALFERAVGDVNQEYNYGWYIEEGSVAVALRAAAAGSARARDVELVLGDERLFSEFVVRISPSGSIDYYEGDESDPSDYDLGPEALYGSDLADALRSACAMAVQYGWAKP